MLFLLFLLFSFYPILSYSNTDLIEGNCFDISYLTKEKINQIEFFKDLIIENISVSFEGPQMIPFLPKVQEKEVLNIFLLKNGEKFSFLKLFESCKKIRGRFDTQNYTIEKINENKVRLKFFLNTPVYPFAVAPRVIPNNDYTAYMLSLFSTTSMLGKLTLFNFEGKYIQFHKLEDKPYLNFTMSYFHPINYHWSVTTSFRKELEPFIYLKYFQQFKKFQTVKYRLMNFYSLYLTTTYHHNYEHEVEFGFELSSANLKDYSPFDSKKSFNISNSINSNLKRFILKNKRVIFHPYLLGSYQYAKKYYLTDPIYYITTFVINPSIRFSPSDFSSNIPQESLILNFNVTNVTIFGIKDFAIENYLSLATELIKTSDKNFNLNIAGFPPGVAIGKNFYTHSIMFRYTFFNLKKDEVIHQAKVSVGLFYLLKGGNAWDSLYYFDGMFKNLYLSNMFGLYLTFSNIVVQIGVSAPLYPKYSETWTFYFQFRSTTISKSFKLFQLYNRRDLI